MGSRSKPEQVHAADWDYFHTLREGYLSKRLFMQQNIKIRNHKS